MENLLVFGLLAVSILYVGKKIYSQFTGAKQGTCMSCRHNCSGCTQHKAKK